MEDAKEHVDDVRVGDRRHEYSHISRLHGMYWHHGAHTTSAIANGANFRLDSESHNYGTHN